LIVSLEALEEREVKALTVRFLVSGMKKKMTVACIPHQMVKMMYVLHPILSIDIGQTNWFRSIAAATANPENPMPFARISNERTSTGYSAWRGVKPTAYTAPKMKMKARDAAPALWLVPGSSGTTIDSWYFAADTVIASQTTQQPALEKSRRGRRPTRSTKLAPNSAKQNCWQLLIKVILD
jgi:hypothetical protein